jgi:pimeloyl-ACP methyl ester carboxylesterase
MQQRANPIVLIHGLWMTSLSWEKWIARYAAQGYSVIARSWPGMDVDIDELRRDPSSIATLGIGEIVDYYGDCHANCVNGGALTSQPVDNLRF